MPADPEADGGRLVGVGVQLEHQRLAGPPVGHVVEDRCHHVAGAAPVGVEVHQYRNARSRDGAVEVGIRHLERAVEPDGPAAFAALGPGVEPARSTRLALPQKRRRPRPAWKSGPSVNAWSPRLGLAQASVRHRKDNATWWLRDRTPVRIRRAPGTRSSDSREENVRTGAAPG